MNDIATMFVARGHGLTDVKTPSHNAFDKKGRRLCKKNQRTQIGLNEM